MRQCSKCGTDFQHQFTLDRNDQYWVYYQCPKCGECTHDIRYKYTPATCPKHQPEFIGTVFIDDPHQHHLGQLFRCDRCGAEQIEKRDLRSAGFSGRIEIDHPKVVNTLLWNQSVYERRIPIELRELSKGALPKEPLVPTENEV